MSYYRPLSRKVFPAPDLEPILLAATRAVEMSLRFNGLPTEELLRAVLASELPEDPQGLLCLNDTERCCFLRKVLPLQRALAGFDSWISGRKAFQSDGRRNLPPIERDGAHTKINPLANWSKAALDGYFARHDLPRHPLEADGFLSVGCMPCTDRVAPGEDARAGRWRGAAKSECGIHR